MRGHRIGPDLFTDVLDVLHRHGFARGDDQHAGRAIFLIGDLARIREGSQDHPVAPSISEAPSPLPPEPPGPEPGPSVPEEDLDAVPSTRSSSTSSAAGSQAGLRRWPSSWKPGAPANQSPTWKPNHDPDPEDTAMTLTINDTTMTSDQTPHTARQAPGHQHQWEVSWLPGRVMDRNTAITAMILADTAAEEDLYEGHRLWPFIQGWAEEVGLTGPDAIARASQPPGDTSRQQQRASRQPDREAAG